MHVRIKILVIVEISSWENPFMWSSPNTLSNAWPPDCMALIYNHLFYNSSPIVFVTKRVFTVAWILTNSSCLGKEKEIGIKEGEVYSYWELWVAWWSGKNVERPQNRHTANVGMDSVDPGFVRSEA